MLFILWSFPVINSFEQIFKSKLYYFYAMENLKNILSILELF